MIMGTIIAFWFGSKSIFGDQHKYSYQFKARKVIEKHTIEIVDEENTPHEAKDIPEVHIQNKVPDRNIDNDVVREWLKTKN